MRVALKGRNDDGGDDDNNNNNSDDFKEIYSKNGNGRNRYLGVVEIPDFSGDIRTVAFPCISTGVYGFPVDEAAETAVRAVRDCLEGRIVLGGGGGGDDTDKYNNNDKDAGNHHTGSQTATAINKVFDRIVFCVFGEADESAYKKWLP